MEGPRNVAKTIMIGARGLRRPKVPPVPAFGAPPQHAGRRSRFFSFPAAGPFGLRGKAKAPPGGNGAFQRRSGGWTARFISGSKGAAKGSVW
jgi:hypothetical protein